MTRLTHTLFFILALTWGLEADPAFWDKASGLLTDGKVEEADTLAQQVLSAAPDDADALVVSGTAVLYRKMQPRKDDSIYRPQVDAAAPPEVRLTPEGAEDVAAVWKKVPGKDPGRAYLWGDLAQLTFRSGDTVRAMDYALQALNTANADPDTLQAAASVFALNLDWAHAAQTLAKIPGNRTAIFYAGLDSWRTGKEGWKTLLKSYADAPGPNAQGAKLAAYLTGPDMRDSEVGFQGAIQVDDCIGTLAVRQKYVDRYPDKFMPRLDFARSLSQYGSFGAAVAQFSELDRRTAAKTPDEKQSSMFQEAWAYQGSGRHVEADRLWKILTDSQDFYIRSAAAWFLGESALAASRPAEAKSWWTWSRNTDKEPRISDEPARSKYAAWALEALNQLK